MTTPWMIYGAYGYTGRLLVQEALHCGHRPILAGRSADKLLPLASETGLVSIVVDLEEPAALRQALKDVDLVLHTAGPFALTSTPMLKACLDTHTHYVDITGEIPVFQNSFSLDPAAVQQGVTVVSGAGFDVVPTDCLAAHLARRLPGAAHLELAFASLTGVSSGTARSALLMMKDGGLVRRNGMLKPYPLGSGAKVIRFADHERLAIPVPWGDLETAYRSTGIDNITTYMAMPPRQVRMIRLFSRLIAHMVGLASLQRLLSAWIDRSIQGPSAEQRATSRSLLWGRAFVSNGPDPEVRAWMETPEAYRLTSLAALKIAEQVIANPRPGAWSPAQLLGPDFILEIEGVKRWDHLP